MSKIGSLKIPILAASIGALRDFSLRDRLPKTRYPLLASGQFRPKGRGIMIRNKAKDGGYFNHFADYL